MLKCKKCGAELADGQRACIECGETTVAGGKFDYGETRQIKLTRKHKYAIAGAILLVIIVLIARGLRTVPPDKVAGEWFEAMVQRQVGRAQEYVTPKLEQDLQSRMMDLRAMSDEFYTEINDYRATYEVSPPAINDNAKPPTADVTIAIKYPGEGDPKNVRLQMVKVGRQWRVNKII